MISKIIVDSDLSLKQVLEKRQQIPAPVKILNRQRMLEVTYYSFDDKLHKGQIVLDIDLVEDIKNAFALIRKVKFPIKSAIPYVDRESMTEEERLASMNNTSAFNYRMISGSQTLSNHAFGRAIDINPGLNPFIDGKLNSPEGSKYNLKTPGTIIAGDELTSFFKKCGWTWGGDWTNKKDYMHFEKQFYSGKILF